jgi:hypothetical protein
MHTLGSPKSWSIADAEMGSKLTVPLSSGSYLWYPRGAASTVHGQERSMARPQLVSVVRLID